VALTFAILAMPLAGAALYYQRGETVRLARGEMLMFKGEKFVSGPKGQEFPVLQQDAARGVVYVPFVKEDGSLIAVTVPTEALEPAPRDPWLDLRLGVEAFREGRVDEARIRLVKAAQDPATQALATPVAARVNTALAARSKAAWQAVRDISSQLATAGHTSLALGLEEGADKLGGAEAPPSKLDRADLAKRAAAAQRAVARTRQAIAWKRMAEAAREIEAGLAAEPARPELLAWQPKVKKDVAEAEGRAADAERMRRVARGTIHALTAIEHGLKVCADHPQLIALRKNMEGAFEARTSPKVDATFLSAAGGGAERSLTEGRALYTLRCTECHELELVDSRTLANWERTVAGMARRAGVNGAQQAQILEYIAAAQKVVEKMPPE
jgi:hypothetical protein